jgi:hypothetical protein
MTRGRIARPPATRNLELYHELVCEGKTQAEIAAEFQISQPRVASVCRKVARWVEALVSPAIERAKAQLSAPNERLDNGQKLHLAVGVLRLRLTQSYGKFLDYFGGTKVALAFVPILKLWDEGAIPETLAALLPRRDVLVNAVRMAAELEGLARLAARGPFAALPADLPRAESCTNCPPAAPPLSAPVTSAAPAAV